MTGWPGQGPSSLLGTCTAKSSVSSKQEKSYRKNVHVRALVFTGNGPASTQGLRDRLEVQGETRGGYAWEQSRP